MRNCWWVILILLTACSPKEYPVIIDSNAHIGHVLRGASKMEAEVNDAVDYLIIGGGVSGLSAAYQLRDSNFVLFELDDKLGGTSAYYSDNGSLSPKGAHYELAYPNYYGKEGLETLKDLNIIYYDSILGLWNFKDQQFIIPENKASKVWVKGVFRSEMFPNTCWLNAFEELMDSLEGGFGLPLKSNAKYDSLSFKRFIENSIGLPDSILPILDFHMRDDYGANSDEVSASAGIAYYACRPYYKQLVPIFSPPNGNGYFVDKLVRSLPSKKVKNNHLVTRVKKEDSLFNVEVIDLKAKKKLLLKAVNVIYAGKLHGLKYIFPEAGSRITVPDYAPWLSISVFLEDLEGEAFWQNELLVDSSTFIGFIDNRSQFSGTDRILTGYYCYPKEERFSLLSIDTAAIIQETINHMNTMLKRDITNSISKVRITSIGHGMAIPKMGYLGVDWNDSLNIKGFAIAGSDNGRLPLFFEALDGGIQAVKKVNDEI